MPHLTALVKVIDQHKQEYLSRMQEERSDLEQLSAVHQGEKLYD